MKTYHLAYKATQLFLVASAITRELSTYKPNKRGFSPITAAVKSDRRVSVQACHQFVELGLNRVGRDIPIGFIKLGGETG